jgi:hypothetical protein
MLARAALRRCAPSAKAAIGSATRRIDSARREIGRGDSLLESRAPEIAPVVSSRCLAKAIEGAARAVAPRARAALAPAELMIGPAMCPTAPDRAPPAPEEHVRHVAARGAELVVSVAAAMATYLDAIAGSTWTIASSADPGVGSPDPIVGCTDLTTGSTGPLLGSAGPIARSARLDDDPVVPERGVRAPIGAPAGPRKMSRACRSGARPFVAAPEARHRAKLNQGTQCDS